jgi:uncharacterized OB-fold protein
VTIITPPGPRSLPALNDGNRAFWSGGRGERLLVPRCESCRRWALPPTDHCPGCGGDTTAEEVSGRARLYTWTVNWHQYHPDVPPPTIIAIVELVEQDGLRLATNLVNCDEQDLAVDMELAVLFEQHGEVFYPLFEPVGAP